MVICQHIFFLFIDIIFFNTKSLSLIQTSDIDCTNYIRGGNKKMRHKIFLILFLLSLYVVYISCTDLLNDSSKEGQWTSSFSLDEARTYFEENAEDLQPLTLSARVKTRNDGASAIELPPTGIVQP